MIRFERTCPGRWHATANGQTIVSIERFAHTTYWIAWDAKTQQAIRGPFGLGGSPFRGLAAAKQMIREQYEGQS